MSSYHRRLRPTLAAAALCAATATAVFSPVAAATPGPSAGQLNGKLALLLNEHADAGARANELEAGAAGVPLVNRIHGVMNTVPSLRWTVLGPVSTANSTANATLEVHVDGFAPFHIPLTWRDINGTWKLTRQSECSLAYYSSQTCDV